MKYRVEFPVTARGTQTYIVEAGCEEEAIRLAAMGDGELEDESLEVENCEESEATVKEING